MKKIFLICLITVSMSACSLDDSAPQVCFGDLCVEVEIADDHEEQKTGLMFRKKMDDDKGMLFVYQSEQKHVFWMKNTLIPLDMIWINKDKKIVDIQSVDPCEQDPCERYEPAYEALYVLEVNKGFADENGVKVGDTIELKNVN